MGGDNVADLVANVSTGLGDDDISTLALATSHAFRRPSDRSTVPATQKTLYPDSRAGAFAGWSGEVYSCRVYVWARARATRRV